ncbi:tape measure protein [Sphingobium sp. CCH11-B1]|uniref:tape measure protein n=1 Tax=Sphingobium sp. CCH11-B1 TaxID=1768781 RepID=UPI00083742C4|nr:tape measure protein [Sphingobium sp. CCH11-B1]
MAVTADRVVVELEARLDRYEANVARAEAKFDKAMGGIQKSASATEALVSRAMGGITGALAGVSVLALARSFLTITDEAKKLDAQLRLATAGFGSFGQAQRDVQRIADATRSGLVETASLYGNFVRGAKELGASQAEAARATETFSKSLKISGADANQAASATLQFGQALASGALRGDELNSILEASPRLARLLADSMGQPIGQIKQLGEEGKLTSDKLLAALTDRKFTAGIDSEFQQLPVTFDDAMTRVYNAAITTFSAFDKGGEFSSYIASFFGESTDGFTSMEEDAFNAGAEIRATFAGLTDVFQPLIDAAFGAFDKIETRANYARDSIANILRLIDNADNLLIGIDNFGRRFDNRVKATFNEAARRAGNTGGEFAMTPLAKEADRAGKFLKSFNQSMAVAQGKRAEDRFRANNFISGVDVFGNPLPGTPGAAPGKRPSAPSSSGKKTRTPRSKLNPEAFAREEASLNDEILRLKQVEITSADEKAKSEIARAETAKAAAVKDVNADERYTAEQKKKIVVLIETVAALETAKAVYERDVQTAKEALDVRLGDLRNQQDLLRAQTDLADTREQRRDLELRLLDLAYQQERAELEAVIASKDATEAQKKIAQARLAALGQMQQAETAGIERQYEGPLARYRRNLDATSTQDQIEELVTQELDYVRDGIRDSITKRLGIKDPFLAGLLDMFIQQNIIKPLAASFAGAGGGIGGIVKTVGSFLGFSSGGSGTIGGRGGTDTNVLSLNGRPFANVSRGETLSVGSKALRGGGGSPTIIQPIIQVDARGAVMNDQFAAQILARSAQQAQQAAATMGQGVLKAVPQRMAQYQTDGT